ncbi:MULTISPECIES: TonB-dependent receptor domain-containing protein [unclassified Brevundimonas]|uniref:TonB-dependent receptor domain-containing protein n=1 Tax=unclassified Brevundimonas TaxID=2622653 RepID=UPI003F9050E8
MKRADFRRRRQRDVRPAFGPFLIIALASLASPPKAEAGQARAYDLHIPRQRVEAALLDLALQTRTSLGGDITACRGSAPALDGRMELDAALTRLLAGSGCRHVIRRDGAVLIRRLPPATPAATPPAPHRVAEAPAPEAVQVSDVIVTAGRRPEAPQRAPTAVTAISASQISGGSVQDLNDIKYLVAGMTVTNLGSGRNKILLRGMSDGAFTGLTQSTVALYLDFVPITYNAPDPDLKLIDVDRVEILRGPQGTLYGTGPIGGVVRTITHRPDLDRYALDLSLTQSHTRSGGDNSDYAVTGNLPLFGGRAGVRGSLYQETYSGYINDVSLNLHRVNDGSRRGGRLAATARLSDDWSLTAGVVHQSIDTEDTHYVYRVLGGLRRANLVREPHANDFSEAYATLSGEGDWGRLDASIAAVSHRFQSRYDASSALRAFGSGARVGALDEGRDIGLVVGEATLSSPDTERLRWLAGGFFSVNSTVSNTTMSALRPVRAVVYAEDRDDQMNEVAVFGEASLELTPDLTLVGGARYHRSRRETVSDVVQQEESRFFRGAADASGLSPKLALAYRVDDALNMYVQVSQGHRTGGFNTAGPLSQTFSGAVGVPAREYRADTLWNYEAGAKATLWEGRLHTRVAIYMARWRDMQSDQFLPSGLAYVVNVGDGANRGLEFETAWRPTEGLEIRANALFANPEITRPSASFNSRGDAGLPGVPKTSANLTAVYRRPIWRDIGVFAEGHLAYVGPSRLTFDAEKRNRMGDYVTGRVSAGFEAERWAVTAFVDNPFDTEANTFSFGDPFRLPEALASTPLRPLTAGITLKWFAE